MNQADTFHALPTPPLNRTGFLVVILDKQGNCVFTNELARKIFLPDNNPNLSISFSDYILAEELPKWEDSIACLLPGMSFTIYLRHQSLQTGAMPLSVKWEVSFGRGEIWELVMVGQPLPYLEEILTNQNTLPIATEAGSYTFRSLIKHVPGVIYRCAGDAFLSLIFFNEHIEVLTGYPLSYFNENRKNGYSSVVYPEDRSRLIKAISKALANKEKFEIEYRIVRKDGELRWVYESGQGVYEAHEQVSYVDGWIFDIHDRKQTELALEKSKDIINRLALVASYTTNSVMITDPEGTIIWLNEGFSRIKGFTEAEVMGKKMDFFFTGQNIQNGKSQKIMDAIKNKAAFNEELYSLHKDGSGIWLDVDCQPLYNDNGEHLGFMAIETDVTKHKESLKQKEELLQRLSLATTSAAIGIYEIDLETREVVWDQKMYALYECTAGRDLNLYETFFLALHPDDFDELKSILDELVTGKKEVSNSLYRIILPGGRIRWIESHAIIKKAKDTGKPISLIGTSRDITQEVLAQQKIKLQNKVLRDIAFKQSHEVRRPLANILGMIEVLKTSGAIPDLEVFQHLEESALQLDAQIREIVNTTNNMDDEIFR